MPRMQRTVRPGKRSGADVLRVSFGTAWRQGGEQAVMLGGPSSAWMALRISV